ncbi:hypothetical protein K470DRAFT_255635 [Piedraia hortae CBS 480.64]|uniref:Inclusion body clearance protein IML2 n=1 Tax=Piedraia hortae CBS 480.64 TaxID=1314780 RepID=A0A6A7C545_9PEZI|nr:hypothetical protein K470DRAFT_255635 [Piedraia hortae CBS 480.64]
MLRWIGLKPSVSGEPVLSAEDEARALAEVMAGGNLIMNDQVHQAKEELSKGTSPFHALGLGITLFLQATLGFEKNMMAEASAKLAEAEKLAYSHQARAVKDPSTAYKSAVYPAGTEYALCQAEAQLMSAVVSVLSENLSEGLKGFFKLRKAFNTLHTINTAETKSLQAHSGKAVTDITSNPIDIFIHSGTAACYGILQLILSMIPPTFAKLLSLFSFRGDREAGLRMLWDATKYKDNINGALAGLALMAWFNGIVAVCDILPKDALPRSRLANLMHEMQQIYPESKLWQMEEARMHAANRELEKAAIAIEKSASQDAHMQQVEALRVFERSLNFMFIHRYHECADSFVECSKLNNWSRAVYYYMAGISHVELYRSRKTEHPEKADKHAAKVDKYLQKAMSHSGRNFMGRQMPFDLFVTRKINKWETRAKDRNCRLVDAVGVSPTVEMDYFWPGLRQMNTSQLNVCLKQLDTVPVPDIADEKALHSFLKAACLRFSGEIQRAKEAYTEIISTFQSSNLKLCPHPDTWVLPVTHYELAACYWVLSSHGEGDPTLLKKCTEELHIAEHWESYDLDTRIGMKIATAKDTLRSLKS